jgi:hypothetical protein
MHLKTSDIEALQTKLALEGLYQGEVTGIVSDELIATYKLWAYNNNIQNPEFPNYVASIPEAAHTEEFLGGEAGVDLTAEITQMENTEAPVVEEPAVVEAPVVEEPAVVEAVVTPAAE